MLKRSNAFSLIELLVAISVALLVGGAILTALLRTFEVWNSVGGKTGELRAIDDFDIAFSRDFASLTPKLGFTGTDSGCLFWTFRPTSDNTLELVRVKYAIDSEGICSETWKLTDKEDAPGELTRYATSIPSTFLYGDTNSVHDAWLPGWQSTSNAPMAIVIELNSVPPLPARRLYERRTP